MKNNKSKFLKYTICAAAITFSTHTQAQLPFKLEKVQPKVQDSVKTDSLSKARTSIKPYNKVITKDFTSYKGLFTVHRNKDLVYFEIPDSILLREIMVINRLSKVSPGYGIYAGEELDQNTIKFDKGKDSSIKIRTVLYINEADSNSAIFKSLSKANVDPIMATFPILAYGKNSSVIDVSKIIKDKTIINSVTSSNSLAKNAGTGYRDINIESIKAYPLNVEIKVSKNTDSKLKTLPDNTPLTLETQTSFIVLPKVPMGKRYFDPRVGFFADRIKQFSDEQQKVSTKFFALRWRLEPQEKDLDKWKKGQLVKPKKPIVIYIDPGTPKQWRPYLIAGINDWQKAFEEAGFKNAIIGKEWPGNDTTMDMDDARYSVLNYLPSETANAYGPNVHDPRSGEIIQTHIGWYHNVMQLVHDWYFVQAAATDPKARKARFDDELMGQLVRFVSSHEVGHTLGLRHNFGSSSKTPVDSLRNKQYLDVHGHTASIMDYARFNYVAQPEDNIPQNDLFPRIGEYDKWAIEWGYKYVNGKNAEENENILKSLTTTRLQKNERLWFGDGETRRFDARCQTEDLSDNVVKANTYGILNLKRLVPNIVNWTKESNGTYEALTSAYTSVQSQYFRYMGHVLKIIGGIRYDERTDGDLRSAYLVETKAYQKSAIAFFDKELFTTPTWLMDTSVMNKINVPVQADFTAPNFIEDTQIKMINSLLSKEKFQLLQENTTRFGDKAYPIEEYVDDIHHAVWKDLKTSQTWDVYRRNIQKSYVGAIIAYLSSKDPNSIESDVSSVLRLDLVALLSEIQSSLPNVTDKMCKAHLSDLQNRITFYLYPNKIAS
ncbi:MAG: zinc-dependent metalloprotease [Pseudopedobacter saltans]|uniref:Zinc-dependent metalloprotease n=1 Tax=Pseudopedobacter saltans TaxID=151895 RepID=A0A2W5EPL0_9SPHI|nr:MAG: zinc-dependent metalloprotease [Pseudopedobacter saltans]